MKLSDSVRNPNRLWSLTGPLVGLILMLATQGAAAGKMLREMQRIWVDEGGYEIALENDPAWLWEVKVINGQQSFVAQSPELYYPPTTLTVTVYPNIKVLEQDQLKVIAVTALEHAVENYQAEGINMADVKRVTYNGLSGYEGRFTGIAHGKAVDVRAFIGLNEKSQILSMQAYTLKGKLTHIREPLERVWNSIQFHDQVPQ